MNLEFCSSMLFGKVKLTLGLKVRNFFLLLFIWLLLMVIFAILVGGLFRRPYDQLAAHGVAVPGWVTLKEPQNHQNVHYSYVVGSKTFSGVGHGSEGGTPPFEELKVGEQVRVFYDERYPEVSSLGDPMQLLRSANFLTVSAALLFSTFVVAVLYYKGIILRPSR